MAIDIYGDTIDEYAKWLLCRVLKEEGSFERQWSLIAGALRQAEAKGITKDKLLRLAQQEAV